VCGEDEGDSLPVAPEETDEGGKMMALPVFWGLRVQR